MSITLTSRHHASLRRGAGGSPNHPPATVPILVAGTSVAGSSLTITFDQPVILSGTPAFKTDLSGIKAISAQQTADKTIVLTFDAPILGASLLDVGFRDPAVRNTSGGFVTATNIVL